MGKTWKLACLCLVVSFLKLCNGLPIQLERTIADPHIQLASGLIAGILTICTLLLLAGCLCCQHGFGFKEFRDSSVAVSTAGSVDNGLINPTADGAFTIFAPLSQRSLSGSRERFRLDEDYIYGDINVTFWFNEGEHDFPRAKLKYIRELGKGWFGRVVEGTAQDLEEHNTWTSVVVRILESTASTRERVFFLHEAEIYRCGEHTNILKLYGRCLDSVPLLLLQEFCPQGDLKGYLLSNMSNSKNLLASEYPLIWCCQLSSAIKFVHEKGLAHSDLACRNCQLTSNLTLKLGDYGLASSKYPEDYYEGVPTISVRWCAPESIRHTNTTIQSERITREANVWSLAVCFWEICECGMKPYHPFSDDEVVTQVLGKANVRLPRPSHGVLYTDYIYRLMQSCWLTPESRPTPTQIYLTLTDLLQVFTVCKAEHEESMGDSQESFDVRWNSLKPNNIKTSAKLLEEGKAKPTSPSMNNLIGSLEDMNRSRNSDEDNAHSILLPEQFRQKFEFKLGSQSKELFETDSLNDSMIYSMRRSSSSETEEENWKTKIERGAYTEKVRQKSRSVADLMVLTHIDCSESESETPLPSLDHRVNYKNVRLAPKNNLESMGYVHGSEGNLLSVQDDFQAELKKLQEEHRDSLFFVPDNFSRNITAEQSNNNLSLDENNCVVDPSSERLFKELNSTSEIKPANQVYNVFNVTIDNLSPVHIAKLNEIINLEEPRETSESKLFVPYEVPKLCDIIQNNSFVSILSEDTEGTDLNKESECVIESSVNEIETRGISKNTEIASTNKDCESRGDPDVFESRAFIENAESGGINEDSENGTEYNKYTKTLSINKDNENRYAKEYLGSRMTNEESECKILNKYFETKVINKDFEGRVGEAFNKDCEIEEIMEDTVTENSERGDVKEDSGNRLINEQFEGRGVNKNCEIRGINEGSENRGVEEDSERKGVSENSENRGEDSEVIISVSDNVRIAEDMIEPSKSSGYEETDLSKNASHFINAPKDDIDIKYLKIELSPNNEEHISLESDLFETENIKLNKSINDSETLNCLVNTGQSTEGVLDISDTKNFDTCNGGSSETLKELNEKIPKNNRDQILGNIINMLNQKSDNNEHFNDKFMEHRIEAILDNIIEIMSLSCQNMSEVCVEEDEKILNDFIEMERKISEIGTDISETYQIQPKSNAIREKLIKIEIESNLDSIVEKEFSEIEDDFVKNEIESNLNVVETKKDENIPEIEDNFHREIKQPILKFGSKVGERSEIRNNKFTKNQIESNAVETIGDSKTDSEIKDLIFQMDDPVLENCFKINSRSEIEANINRIIENNPEIREVTFFQDKIEEPTYDCIKTNENIEISEIRDGESMKCENDLNIKKNSEMEPPVMKNIIQTSSGLSVNRVEDFIKNEIGFYMNSTKIIDGVEDPLIDYNENEPSLNNSEIKYNVQVLNNIYDINRISGSSEIRDELFKNLIDEQTQSVKDNSESKCEIRDSAPLVDETMEIQRITDGFEIRDELMKNEIVELIPIKTKEVIESISVMNGNMKSHKVSDNIEIKEDGRNESNIRDFELIKSQTDGQVINEVAKKKLFDVESENEWKIVPDELGGKYLKEVKESETSELVHNDTKESLANIEDHLSSAELLSEKVEAEDKKNKLLSKNCEVTSEEKSNVSCQNEENLKESLLPICSIKYQVPRLIDLIENNDKLMDYIIANYESELHDDLSCDNSQNINSIQSNNTVVLTTDAKDDSLEQFPVVDFDLSDSQEATNPNSLTHLNAFSSLRIKQKSLDFISSTPNKNSFSSLKDDESDTSGVNEDANLNYSLETWDNFLGTAIDHQNQNINDQTFVFGSLNSEPQSLMFVENGETVTPPNSDMEASMDDQPFFLTENQTINIQEGDDDLNKTYVLELNNKTYELSPSESRLSVENGGNVEQVSGIWEPSGGWFLHPQSSNSVSGQMTEQKDTGSYVKFGMDDEILAALRGELLAKLPHAQGTSSDRMKENEDEWDPSEKEEVFLRYNVYNTPLSPIPEESESEDTDNSDFSIPRSPNSEVSDDWPEKFLEGTVLQENESRSLKTQGFHQQHTSSQDSCCSNDTLFNLEDMTCVALEQEKELDVDDAQEEEKLDCKDEQMKTEAINYFKIGTTLGVQLESPIMDLESPIELLPDKTYVSDFLAREREYSELVSVVITENLNDAKSESTSSKSIALNKHVAPLPSPDDHPWKQLSASLLSYDRFQKKVLLDSKCKDFYSLDNGTVHETEEESTKNCKNEGNGEIIVSSTNINVKTGNEDLPSYVNIGNIKDGNYEKSLLCYVNVGGAEMVTDSVYENVGVVEDVNEGDYVNIANLENGKIVEGFDKVEADSNETFFPKNADVILEGDDPIVGDADEKQGDIFGVLTDIRFSGPGESHLMSTSFSESNNLNEQDWDSGSDTRSSSSGEFIWKLEDDIKCKGSNREETSSDSSCSDEEGECPEFVPSAWDKYATPTKSALRSPEKTLEKEEKKKGVWFKKQRYHCVYEYPREPESPILQSFDLWNNPPPVTSYPEWYFDMDSGPEFNEFICTSNLADSDSMSADFKTSFNNEFYVTSSATPFDMVEGTTSQFFPGGERWTEPSKRNENTTPDSGVEDITPLSLDKMDFGRLEANSTVPSLKYLSEIAYSKLKHKEEDRSSKILGGLRHTRDKLKLDLPPSPNNFSSNKTFNLEPNTEPVVLRERPSFTTFGKSRFLVQHVDTPDKDITGKNVCFEALPYKPPEKKETELKTKNIKKEEKGEASLLDSADEDSGIESSTLERKPSEIANKLLVDL